MKHGLGACEAGREQRPFTRFWMAKGKQYTGCGHELAMIGSHRSASLHAVRHLEAGSALVYAGIVADLVSPSLRECSAALHGGGEEGAEDGGAKEVQAAECIPEC